MRTRIDWQYLLGLRFDDPGFDHTVLAEFRGRVAGAGLEQVVLDALLARLVSEGLVKAGGKQRTDSTYVTAAVSALRRLELAGGERAGGAGSPGGGAPGLAGTAGLRERHRSPLRHSDDLLAPAAVPSEQDELAIAYARDGYALLEAVTHGNPAGVSSISFHTWPGLSPGRGRSGPAWPASRPGPGHSSPSNREGTAASRPSLRIPVTR